MALVWRNSWGWRRRAGAAARTSGARYAGVVWRRMRSSSSAICAVVSYTCGGSSAVVAAVALVAVAAVTDTAVAVTVVAMPWLRWLWLPRW
eukprot:363585-Chlamydomonas_euryale.AAC.8